MYRTFAWYARENENGTYSLYLQQNGDDSKQIALAGVEFKDQREVERTLRGFITFIPHKE